MDILNNRYKEALNRKRHAENEDLQRYLFLDIDGVLNTIRYSDYLIDHDEDEYDEDGALFDPEAVANLAYIIEKVPDVKIIISSTWRLKGWEWLNRLWKKRQMPGHIYSITPALERICFSDLICQENSFSTYPYGIKGLEINEWLRKNNKRGSLYYYAILDDVIDFLTTQSGYIAPCNPQDGLTRGVADKVIEILHVEYEEEMRENIINFDKMPHSNHPIRFLDAVIYEDGRTNRRDLGKNKRSK